jgi:hypothetical protein
MVATSPHIIITAKKLTTSFDLNDIFIVFPENPQNSSKIPDFLNKFSGTYIKFLLFTLYLNNTSIDRQVSLEGLRNLFLKISDGNFMEAVAKVISIAI